MAKLVKWEKKPLPALRVIGRSLTVNFKEMQSVGSSLPSFWKQCFADRTMETLDNLSDETLEKAYVGWMGEWDEQQQTFTYLVGVSVAPATEPPEGFDCRDIAPCTVAVSWIQGPESEIFKAAHQLSEEALKDHGCEYDNEGGWSMEVYACPRFTTLDADGHRILDYYLPCR